MRRWTLVALLACCSSLSAEPVSEALERARALEEAGRPTQARGVLASAASSENDPQALLAYAEFLDRYHDPARVEAYQRALEALGPAASGRKRHIARRLAVLAVVDGDEAAARDGLDAYRKAGGAGLDPIEQALERQAAPQALGPYGSTQIPGPLYSFRRMAALSSDQEPEELLPALARNVMTSGYRASRGPQGLEQTEYLKLLLQYLDQARELEQFAGPDQVIDVPACESEQTAQLLKILGFRLRNECGPTAVLETVNPSRAFLSIDSGFPLADLEHAYRTGKPWRLDYKPTSLPVLFGPDYWMSGAGEKSESGFITTFLNDPTLARLFVAMANLHRPTALELRDKVKIETLKSYAHVLDFFGGMFEIRNGRAVVPGGYDAAKTWQEMVGERILEPARFFQKLIELDDGWMAAYFDALLRAPEPARSYFTEPRRMKRFWTTLRGRVTSPGPARPIFRANSDLLLMTSRLIINSGGKAYLPGGLEVWRRLFFEHKHSKATNFNKEARGWDDSEDVVDAMFAFTRKVIENDPLQMFMAISNVDRHRAQKLQPQTVWKMMEAYEEYGDQFTLFNDAPNISDESIIAYLDLMPGLLKGGNQVRKANRVGMLQGLLGLWSIFCRQGQIPPEQADPSFRKIVALFDDIDDELQTFEAGRAGLKELLAAAGTSPDASPQDTVLELLAGKPGPGEASIHEEVRDRLETLFRHQRLVPLKTLFDLADHLERVSRGETFNVAMANRLAARISEIRLPRSNLSSAESNAFAHGHWVEKHISEQRSLNLRREVDKARDNAQKLSEIRGLLGPILRDTLVGLNYIYYSPPGAELIRANPLFVRSHDFLGIQGTSSWQMCRLLGTGWPSSGGGRLVGSLVGLSYALNEAEQNFLVPVKRQALIWQDLAPQVLLGVTVTRWWGVSRQQQHFVALHLRLGEELVAQAAANPGIREWVYRKLRPRAEPARLWTVEQLLEQGRLKEAVQEVTPAEHFHLAKLYMKEEELFEGLSSPCAREIRRLAQARPEEMSYDRIERIYGMPHPMLAHSYQPELLHLPLFPTMMGYSSRIMAESWESNNLYWAALADEMHLAPAQLNLLAPRWTRKSLERIFATHLEDWPALMRSIRFVADDYRASMRPAQPASVQAASRD